MKVQLIHSAVYSGYVLLSRENPLYIILTCSTIKGAYSKTSNSGPSEIGAVYNLKSGRSLHTRLRLE